MMGTKNNPGNFDCYANADPDEPMFILLGRDPHAPAAVRQWAFDRMQAIAWGTKPPEDMPMVIEALECAAAMGKFWLARYTAKCAAERAAQPEEPLLAS